MPRYRVTSPDGQTVTLTGDAPPTADQIRAVFAKLPPKGPTMGPPRSDEDFGGVWPSAEEEAASVAARHPEPEQGKAMLRALSLLPLAVGGAGIALPRAVAAAPGVARAAAPAVEAAAPAAAAGGSLLGTLGKVAGETALEALIPGGRLGKMLYQAGRGAWAARGARAAVPAVEAAAPVAEAVAAAPALGAGASASLAPAVDPSIALAMRIQGLMKGGAGNKALVKRLIAESPPEMQGQLTKLLLGSITRLP